jgi:hypothetical protein
MGWIIGVIVVVLLVLVCDSCEKDKQADQLSAKYAEDRRKEGKHGNP